MRKIINGSLPIHIHIVIINFGADIGIIFLMPLFIPACRNFNRFCINIILRHTAGDEAAFNDYFDIVGEVEDAVSPKFILRLKKDMPADFELTVRATSRHALGVNKANSQYSLIYYGEKVVQPRKTLVNSSTNAICHALLGTCRML